MEHEENVALETELAGIKASLKAQKVEVAEMITELEFKGRSLSRSVANPLHHMSPFYFCALTHGRAGQDTNQFRIN